MPVEATMVFKLLMLLLTHECPSCFSAYATRHGAVDHLRHAANKDVCMPDLCVEIVKRVSVDEDVFVCQVCQREFHAFRKFYKHGLGHFVGPLKICCQKCLGVFNNRQEYDEHVCDQAQIAFVVATYKSLLCYRNDGLRIVQTQSGDQRRKRRSEQETPTCATSRCQTKTEEQD